MLIALNRRVPRTKSIFDRTSSRRNSSVEYDPSGYYDTQHECVIIDNHNHNGNGHSNHFNLTDSMLRQNNDEAMGLSNECDAVSILFDEEDDSDEYALLYFTNAISLFLIHWFCFASMLLFFLAFVFEFYQFTLDGKHELKVPQMIDKVCDELQCMQCQLLRIKIKKCKKNKY